MLRVRFRAVDEKSKIFFAFGGTAEARLPSIFAANASMPPRCGVTHTSAVSDIGESIIGIVVYIIFDVVRNISCLGFH